MVLVKPPSTTEVLALQSRWRAVETMERQALQATSFTVKYRQLCALFDSRSLFGTDTIPYVSPKTSAPPLRCKRRLCSFSPNQWIPSNVEYGQDDRVLAPCTKVNGIGKVPDANPLHIREFCAVSLRRLA
jgi:hypothetical protein